MLKIVAKLRRAYLGLGMSMKEYLTKVALPMLGVSAMLWLVFILGLVPMLPSFIGWLFPVAGVLLVVFYPMLNAAKRAHEIDINMHYFITQMGALITADIPRLKLLEMLGKNEKFGALAEEITEVHFLMDTWHLSLPEACRFVGSRTPSTLLADFLDRFAHSVQSGEDTKEFLRSEQTTVMADFEQMYLAALKTVDVVKEAFMSLVMALIFLASFGVIMPIIMGGDSTVLLLIVLVMFIVVDVVVVYMVKLKVGNDPLWHQLKIETDAERRLKRTFPISIVGCTVVGFLLVFASDVPPSLLIAMTLTPLAYTGWVAKGIESEIIRRDNNYAAFIRSLGSSASARGGLITDALATLRMHDFGPLTDDIHKLYKRLLTRLNKYLAWDMFSAGTGSNLIQRFSIMFVEATDLGGKPDVIGHIISENFHRVVLLRKHKYQSASSFIGVLYGLTAGIAFTMFISVSITEVIQGLYQTMEVPAGMETGFALSMGAVNVETVRLVVLFILVVHSFLSSLLVRTVDGGHIFNTYLHFVGMVWISAMSAIITSVSIHKLLGIA
ncbi:MAG: archaellar assembly protein FlaJ [Methermicoccaceae archaeon]